VIVRCKNSATIFAYSSDGINWTNLNNGIFDAGGIFDDYKLSVGNGIILSIGTGTNTIAYSTNGTIWVGLGTPIANPVKIGWNGSKFVAIATNFSSISSNGTQWSLSNQVFSSLSKDQIIWDGVKWLILGNNNNIYTSYDGITWYNVSITSGLSLYSINYDYATNTYLGFSLSPTTRFYSSIDGITWTIKYNYGSAIPSFSQGNYFMQPLKIFYVNLDTSLANVGICSSNTGNLVVGGQYYGKFVAVGTGNSPISYGNGFLTFGNTNLHRNIFRDLGNQIISNGSFYLSVGRGNNSIAYSNNEGTIWTGSGTSIFSIMGSGVTWSGTNYVSVGSGTNTIAYSTDGTSWTGLGTSIFSSFANKVI
jgi:hypothetical protein